MTSAAEKILQEALALPETERESLANALLTSLGRTPAEQSWADEVAHRLVRELRGETMAIPWEEAMRQIKAAHGLE